MRWTQYLIPTLKEIPQEAQIKSHRLMLRAGLIRKLASGTYSYLPLGLRALQKAAGIIREEMDRAGALEVLLPAIHPVDLWKESGRLDILGEDMIHFKDRHGKENVLGPTHEEVITDLVRREIHSYKQLPVTLYQIQTKFRDEMRPRSGIIRSREFIMKDAYSFHKDYQSLDVTYNLMMETYMRIFHRCGLEFYIVKADPGAMGGSGSQEFVLFSDAGEDRVVRFGNSDNIVSVEMARRVLKNSHLPKPKKEKKFKPISTPNMSSVDAVCKYLKKKPTDLVKTMIYEVEGSQYPDNKKIFMVLVRGDHEISEYKIKQIYPGAHLAAIETIARIGSAYGYSGPIGLSYSQDIPLYIDEDVLLMNNFVIGSNQKDHHIIDFNVVDIVNYYSEHYPETEIRTGDYRQVVEGDKGYLSWDVKTNTGEGECVLNFKTAIELGHIFKLNLRYSNIMKANFLDSDGKEKALIMGCYGIGVNRILAAAIEQHGDEKGIVWPKNISPFQLLVIMLDPKDAKSHEIVETLLNSPALKQKQVDILVDDRPESAGVKFHDADLIGIPLRVILGPKNLKDNKAELKIRKTSDMALVDISNLIPAVLGALDKIV